MSAPGTRVQVIHEIGVKIDDALEKAQLDTARREGAHEAYKSAASSLAALLQQVDKEHAGRDAEVAKSWINRVVTIFKNISDHTKDQVQIARGAEKQTRVMVDMLKQMYDAEAKPVNPAPQPAPVPKLIPASAQPVQSAPAPAANVAPVQALKPVVAAPPAPPPALIKPAPAPPSSTTPGTTPRMTVKSPTPAAPLPPAPPPPPAPELKKPGRKPKKESKQPEPPPPPAPPKRTRPISIKERRNKGME